MRIETLRDVETFEAVPYQQRWRGRNTYELLDAARRNSVSGPLSSFSSRRTSKKNR